jgi:hypothetical protein
VRFLASLFLLSITSTALADPIEDSCIAAAVDGQKQRKAGKLKEARETFSAGCSKIECPKEISERCTGWLGELESAIPSVVVSVQDANGLDVLDAEVRIDGAVHDLRSGKAVEIDPGVHTIDAARGDSAAKMDVVVREGERTRMIRIALPPPHVDKPPVEPEPPPPKTGWQWAAITSGGVAVVATGFFIGLAAVGVSDRSRLGCDVQCGPAAYSQVNTEFIAADVMLGVAIASVGATVVFWLLSRPSAPSKPPIALLKW